MNDKVLEKNFSMSVPAGPHPERRRKAADLLSQKALLEGFLQKERFSLSAYAFVSIFGWLDFFDFEMRKIHDALCVLARDDLGAFLVLPPLGAAIRPETVNDCFSMMARLNNGSGVSRIENVRFEDLKHFPEERFRVTLKGYEYCYFRDDITAFKGGAFKSKRSSYNQFVRQQACEFRPFMPGMKDECMVLYEKWAEKKTKRTQDDIYRQMIVENRVVHDLLMEYAGDLGLTGRVARIHGAIKGYTFGFPLNENVFCVLLEITDPDIVGLPTFIFREFCRDNDIGTYAFINVMDDFGMTNIARTKFSFRPAVMVPSYTITGKEF